MAKSRTQNTFRNTFFAAFSYTVKMLLQFFVRAIFIRYFVVEYLGINGLFTNILNVLSLAELGVGNAIVYSMYKPISTGDTEKIKSLVRLYRNIYLVIGIVITALGLALIPALPYLIKDAPNVDINLTAIYVLFLAQTVIGYFFAYRRCLVFAYQRNDIESKVSFVVQTLLALVQVVIIILWKNFYAYTVAVVVGSLLDALIVFLISYKLFPDIRGKAKKLEQEDVKVIAKNTSALLIHKLGSAAVFSTDSIIISAFLGAGILGVYSNYTLVTGAFSSIVGLLMTALRSSIGNYITDRSPQDAYKLFKALNMCLMWLVSFIAIGMAVCFQDFIRLYSGKEEYLLPYFTVLLICISFYFTYSRQMVNAFKECAGLFWNDRFKPLFEAGINLALDILLVKFWGINGVIIATITTTITIPLWIEPYVLFKNYFKVSFGRYFVYYGIYLAVSVLAGGLTYYISTFIPSGGVTWFLLKLVLCVVLVNGIYLLVAFKTPEFAYLRRAVVAVLKGIKGGKNKTDKQENTD